VPWPASLEEIKFSGPVICHVVLFDSSDGVLIATDDFFDGGSVRPNFPVKVHAVADHGKRPHGKLFSGRASQGCHRRACLLCDAQQRNRQIGKGAYQWGTAAGIRVFLSRRVANPYRGAFSFSGNSDRGGSQMHELPLPYPQLFAGFFATTLRRPFFLPPAGSSQMEHFTV
jgi:hypothetical protein